MPARQICHEGTVRDVAPDMVTVEITGRSACVGCHARSVCSASDEEVRLISVPPPAFELFEPGDRVMVEVKKSMGLKAVWISYVIPLAILMILILSLSGLALAELYVGLLSLAGVALYYGVIYLLRDRISKEFYFTIRRIDNN